MYQAQQNRYENFEYRKVGKSGLVLPPLALGLWHNFGHDGTFTQQKEMLHTAFDLGINHFDLANNYGTPYGSAEETFGRVISKDFKPYRDELIISTKAGWDMWSGPYGQGGSSRKHLLSSLDQSLQRLNLEYVDIFYSHRYDADTPLEETASALIDMVKQGKALYVGISSGYTPELTQQLASILAQEHISLLAHQPNYNLFNREIEGGLLQACADLGVGTVVFSPLAQGLLGGRYVDGIPQDSRIGKKSKYLEKKSLTPEVHQKIQALNGLAKQRGQTLAQFSIAWVLRDKKVTSAIIGASTPQQIKENLKSLDNLAFSQDELKKIDEILK